MSDYGKMENQLKGSYQRSILRDLLSHCVVTSPQHHIIGKAKNYMRDYERSFAKVIKVMEENGYYIERTPGPRGGEYGAKYRLVNECKCK